MCQGSVSRRIGGSRSLDNGTIRTSKKDCTKIGDVMEESDNNFLKDDLTGEPGIRVWVPGLCKPAGSKRGFFNKKSGKVMIVDACAKSRPWKTDVKAFATEVYKGPPLMGPVEVIAVFYVPRPKGHYGSGKNAAQLKSSAPAFPTTKPDLLKLMRACEDALTGVIYKDDSQIVVEHMFKVYADQRGPGVSIEIIPLDKPDLNKLSPQ
jgi:Holliday junction resolvase